ncbi:flagellar basal body rod protein FlgC [Trinickia fusca]|uniref:Flagellar basal-body rod protein FlgC n=1 Tax=Trinickia fusca TaxID=2419777 RepID=A0A494XJZ5_9BURK|nr:flagellar basal body rod protein FlgC [Trinickia fusca]RKP48414.1 flagellar basal body rod protein FlgC [Trinickia fusca]
MDYSQAFAISAAGMSTERMRVDVAALNLANANTAQTADGVSYRPLRVIVRSLTAGTFAQRVDDGLADASGAQATSLPLPQADVEPADVKPRLSYEPGHPFADKKGFVSYPGVDTATEMVGLMTAIRSYEANVAAMNTARTLALRALDIGSAS